VTNYALRTKGFKRLQYFQFVVVVLTDWLCESGW